MELISSFRERLIEAMGDMSVTDFADLLGISKQSISAYINGTRTPKRLTISAMAQILSVNPAWLMGYNVDKYINDEKKSTTYNVEELSGDEQYLLSRYRVLTDKGKDYIIQTVEMAAQTYKKDTDPFGEGNENVG